MYIIKNALRSISRSKVRNILILILVLVIVISACVSLSILNSAEDAKEATLENINITAQIAVNRQSLIENAGGGNSGEPNSDEMREAIEDMPENLSVEELEVYAKSEYVANFYYTETTSMNGNDDLEPIDTSGSESSDDENSMSGGMDSFEGGPQMMTGMGNEGDFTIVGYSSHDAMADFISGSSSISEGNVFDQDDDSNNCIINSELATFNGLKVGDKITMENPNNEDETFQLTIVGIYESSDATDSGDGGMMGFSVSSDPANRIYMSYTSLNSIIKTSEEDADTSTDEETGVETSSALRDTISGTYVFENQENYDSFQKDAEEMGLDTGSYTIESADLESYEQSLVPIDNLSKYAFYFLLVVLLIGGIILVVFNMFAIRERKYEIGVLAAIGMKKGKVAIQFVSELLIVTLIALIIGSSIGAVISVPVADALLENQIESTTSANETQNERFGGNFQGEFSGGGMPNMRSDFSGGQTTSYIDDIGATVNIEVLMMLLAIGVLLSVVSSAGAIISILRYEPLRILSDRT